MKCVGACGANHARWHWQPDAQRTRILAVSRESQGAQYWCLIQCAGSYAFASQSACPTCKVVVYAYTLAYRADGHPPLSGADGC